MDPELKALMEKLRTTQAQKVAERLNERNCAELVQQLVSRGLLGDGVAYSLDARAVVTRAQLEREVRQEVEARGGRLMVTDLPAALNVAMAPHVEGAVARVLQADEGEAFYTHANGELLTRDYLGGVAEHAARRLRQRGVLHVGRDVAQPLRLDASLALSVVTAAAAADPAAFADPVAAEGGVLFTAAYVRRQRKRLRGALLAATAPTPAVELVRRAGSGGGGGGGAAAANAAVQQQLYEALAEMVEGEAPVVRGTLEGGAAGGGANAARGATYVPARHYAARDAAIRSEYAASGVLSLPALRARGVSGPAAFLLARHNTNNSGCSSSNNASSAEDRATGRQPGVVLPSVFVAESLVSAAALRVAERLRSAVLEGYAEHVAAEANAAAVSGAGYAERAAAEAEEPATHGRYRVDFAEMAALGAETRALFTEADKESFAERVLAKWAEDAACGAAAPQPSSSRRQKRAAGAVAAAAAGSWLSPSDARVLGWSIVHNELLRAAGRDLDDGAEAAAEASQAVRRARVGDAGAESAAAPPAKSKRGGRAAAAAAAPASEDAVDAEWLSRCVRRHVVPKRGGGGARRADGGADEDADEAAESDARVCAAVCDAVRPRAAAAFAAAAAAASDPAGRGEREVLRLWQLLQVEAAFVRDLRKKEGGGGGSADDVEVYVLKTTGVRLVAALCCLVIRSNGDEVPEDVSRLLLWRGGAERALYLTPPRSVAGVVADAVAPLPAAHKGPVLEALRVLQEELAAAAGGTDAVAAAAGLEGLLPALESLRDGLGVCCLRAAKPRELRELRRAAFGALRPGSAPDLAALGGVACSLRSRGAAGFVHAVPAEAVPPLAAALAAEEEEEGGACSGAVALLQRCAALTLEVEEREDEGGEGGEALRACLAELAAELAAEARRVA